MTDQLTAGPISRRGLLKGALGSLIIGLVLDNSSRFGTAVDLTSRADAADLLPTPVNSWLTIAPDGTITFTIGVSEMGQGSYSSLAQLMAEELYVDYARIRTVHGEPSAVSPAPLGTSVNTVGSSVTRTNYWKVRDAAAIAREMLVTAAMNANGDLTRADYVVADGVITHVPSGITYEYGQVASAAAALTPPATAPLVPANELRLIGKTVPRLDIAEKVNGSAIYGLDVRLPGMLYAIIKHSPAFGGTLKTMPSTPAGMTAVVPTKVIAGTARGLEKVGNVNAIAVVGPNTWDTWRAANALKVSWNPAPNAPLLNSQQFAADATALLTGGTPYQPGGANPPGTVYTVEGDAPSAATAISAAPTRVEATYSLPYVAHACMEVLNCTVDHVPGVKCDIYAPTQGGTAVLKFAAGLTGLPTSAIRVITTYLGGGLGRKWELDFISQAIQVAMAVNVPVKLMWPREEDFRHDQYRPMAAVKASAGLDKAGTVVGWSYRNVSPSISAQRGTVLPAPGDGQGIEGAKGLPYRLGAISTQYVSHPSPIPVGYWRSVGASINTFAVECMIDELAAAARQDPYQFRRDRLVDERWRAVLDAAAYTGNWSSPLPRGTARGIAIGAAFNSIVAEVVEITAGSPTATPSFRVRVVSVAIDPLTVVNPGQVEHQIIGGVVHGMNAALYGRQTFSNGAAVVGNFKASRMIRLSEMPEVRVAMITKAPDRADTIGGVGELGVPTFAPALANAYFRLTGQRVRSLPFYPNATMGGL